MSAELVPQHTLDRANQDIVGVISGYIPELKKAGKDWVACCPFHNEKSPSFTVSESKEFFYCYGCGASGDAVKFVQAYTGAGFREAVRSILGDLTLESAPSSPIAPRIKAITCSMPGHAEDREKAADVMARTTKRETHFYLMRNNTAPSVECSVSAKGVLMVPLINNIGETTNVAAVLASGIVSYAAGNPSFGSTAILEPEGEHDRRTIICADYAHAWRIWWAQCGKSRVLCAMEPENFRWMLLNCKERFTHVGCDPVDADEHIDYGRGVVAIPSDPYARLDRVEAIA